MRGLRDAADESGQAIVELALVLPILLLLVVGIIEFARAWNVHEALTDATREATTILALFGVTTRGAACCRR